MLPGVDAYMRVHLLRDPAPEPLGSPPQGDIVGVG